MFDFRLHLSNSCQHDCVRFALRPFLTTFEEQQKKAFFTISLIIWHKDMNIKILMGISSYFLSTLPQYIGIRPTFCPSCHKNKEAGETKKEDFQHRWKSSFVRPQGLEPWTH